MVETIFDTFRPASINSTSWMSKLAGLSKL